MGLFSMNYSKPGPGISKNEPKKKPFFRFFEIFFRKFWDLVKLNLLFSVPVIVVVVLIGFLNSITNLNYILTLPMILISPFVAGLTYVTRNYAKEEHAFILSDFISAIKSNWLAFLINGIVFYFIYNIFSIAFSFYSIQAKTNSVYIFPLFISIVFFGLFLFSQYYVPAMIITFDLKLAHIYKNSFIFSIIGLWRNLLITVILGILYFIIYIMIQLMPLTFLIASAIMLFNFFAFSMFLINFAAFPLINKTMIAPYQVKDEANDIDPDFQDDIK
jgi:uncharacterized membrane protein YesL